MATTTAARPTTAAVIKSASTERAAANGGVRGDAVDMLARLQDPAFDAYHAALGQVGVAASAAAMGRRRSAAAASVPPPAAPVTPGQALAVTLPPGPDGGGARAVSVLPPAYERVDVAIARETAAMRRLAAECDALQAAVLACDDAELEGVRRQCDAAMVALASAADRLVALHTYARVTAHALPEAARSQAQRDLAAALAQRDAAKPAGYDAATSAALAARQAARDAFPDRVDRVVLQPPRVVRDAPAAKRAALQATAARIRRVSRRLARRPG